MARVDRPTGPPPKRSQMAERMARSTLSRPSSSTPNSGQARGRGGEVDGAVAPHLGEVAHPAQQAVGDAGRAPGPAGDLAGARLVDVHAEDAGGPHGDGLQLVGLVVVEAGDEAEAVAQRAGDRAGAGGGADQREPGQVEADRAGGRALAQDDVDLEVLHRRVEHLLDHAREAVHLVDEQHVALAELREHRGEVAGPLDGRARGDVHGHAHLRGDDPGQARLAEAGRAGEQHVVDGLAAAAGRLEDDRQVLLELALADELVEACAGRRLTSTVRSASSSLSSGRSSSSRIGATADRREALEGVAQEEAGVAVVGQVGHDLADLGVGVAEAGQRLAHVGPGAGRCRTPARPPRRRPPRRGRAPTGAT